MYGSLMTTTEATFTTADAAITFIASCIEGGGGVDDADAEYDLRAIFHECFTYREHPGSAQRNGFEQTASEDEFWESVERHDQEGGDMRAAAMLAKAY